MRWVSPASLTAYPRWHRIDPLMVCRSDDRVCSRPETKDGFLILPWRLRRRTDARNTALLVRLLWKR